MRDWYNATFPPVIKNNSFKMILQIPTFADCPWHAEHYTGQGEQHKNSKEMVPKLKPGLHHAYEPYKASFKKFSNSGVKDPF